MAAGAALQRLQSQPPMRSEPSIASYFAGGSLTSDLEQMAPEQFAQVKSLVDAEHLKRDSGASEEELRRKVANMSNSEFESWKNEQVR
jgi:hypothetical protein